MDPIGIGLLVVAIIAVVILVLVCFYYKKYKKNHSSEHQTILPYSVSDQNLEFYRNKIQSRPNGAYIEVMLTSWYGNYALLESKHDYIQWLFPIRTRGVNSEATTLTDKEAKIIRDTHELRNRVLRAFEMMLDFYGMVLVSDHFELAPNYTDRMTELNQWGNHNFLRISRILSALKELGHSKLMLPWLKFLADLIYQSRDLSQAQSSFEEHWISTLDAEDKIKLQTYIRNY